MSKLKNLLNPDQYYKARSIGYTLDEIDELIRGAHYKWFIPKDVRYLAINALIVGVPKEDLKTFISTISRLSFRVNSKDIRTLGKICLRSYATGRLSRYDKMEFAKWGINIDSSTFEFTRKVITREKI